MGKLKLYYRIITAIILFWQLFISVDVYAQISPGDLSKAHSHLEGMSHCTDCHTLGEKVSNDKCLNCHTLLKDRIDSEKGYHSSKEISGKECIVCHSDHHGLKFEMIRFDKNEFDHNLTGYSLTGAHSKQECEKCHKNAFIKSDEVKKKNFTYLGLNTDCLSCHDDYHQNTLSIDCRKCHDFNAFAPTISFDHSKTKFNLIGKHKEVKCKECHKVSLVDGKKFQEFANISHESCADCHSDVHNNKFGQNCTKCHTESSFHIIKSMNDFNHDNTSFKLEAKHRYVDCKECHKHKLTDPVDHGKCVDCHTDYHEGQFIVDGKVSDCSDCHSVNGFRGSNFTIEQHNNSEFPLIGAHLATPCFVCHKKEAKWNFREIGKKCVDCHNNIHDKYISIKYYPEESCEVCHNERRWTNIKFDHLKTGYELSGMHKLLSCKACHFKENNEGIYNQRFSDLDDKCTNCHTDAHFKQFESDGITNCYTCHDYENWKASKFNHDNTRFKLDGKHVNIACISCHKKNRIGNDTYVLYKLNKYKCEDCH